MQQKRAKFREGMAALDVRDLVFVDESGVDTHMVRRYARAAPGERASGSVPFGRYKRLTILGGLAPEGLLGVMSIPAATDTPVFLAYLDQVLIPELVEKKPGAIVVLDNLKLHLVPQVREKLNAAGLPEKDQDSYTRALSFWRSREVDPHRVADFYEIKRAIREATFVRRRPEDVRFWMEKLAAFREREKWIAHGDSGRAQRYDAVARSAVYERALASAAGLSSVAEVHDEIREYFAGIRSVRDPSELEDATTLLIHLTNVLRTGQERAGVSDEEMQIWRREIQGALNDALSSPPGPSGRCMLLESRGLLALASAPETDPQEVVEATLGHYFEVVEAVPDAPLYPLERFADRLTRITHLLGHHPRFRELTERVDDLLAERTGPIAAAAKARDRALVFIKHEDWLAAIGQLQHAMTKWFARETFWGAVASMLLLSQCYRKLKLHSAAKLYALGAAFAAVHTDQPHVLRLLPRALFNAAQADYSQGAWLGFLELYERIRAAFVVAYKSREADGDEGVDVDVDDSPTYQMTVARDITRRIAPGVAPQFQAAIERWGGGSVVDILTERGTPWGTMTVDAIVASCIEQTGAPPFTDIGPERTIRWSALGIDWRIVFPNTYVATARAEEFAGMLQVLQAELAGREMCLLPLAVEIRLRLGAAEPARIEDLRPEAGLRRFQLTVCPAAEEEVQPGEWFGREGGHLLGLALYVFQDVSLLPQSELLELLEWLMQRDIPVKVMIARPYHQLFATFSTPEGFAEESRRSGEVRRSSVCWEPLSSPALAWRSGPGPTYTPEPAAEWVGNRYRDATIPVRLTVERLRRSPAFQPGSCSGRGRMSEG